MTITNRQPAGQPTGGQFATTARPEAGIQLEGPGEPTVSDRLLDLAERAFPPLDATPEYGLGRVDAQRQARALLSGLSDGEFFDHHWFGIESAAMQLQRFEADDAAEEADGASPADTLDVDLMDFHGVNPADRAGEDAYGGYDFQGYADAIADAWRVELRARIARAVAVNDAAQGARTAA